MRQHRFTLDELRLIRDVVDTACDCEAYTLCRMQEMRSASKAKVCGERVIELCKLLSKIIIVVHNEEANAEDEE